MAAKALIAREDALAGLMEGMGTTSRAVGATFGPSGRNVVIERDYGGRYAKDGVSIARVIELEQKLPNIGARLLQQVAVEMSDVAGDGTSLAVILATAMVHEGSKAVAAGLPVNEIRNGIVGAAKVLDGALEEASLFATPELLLRASETAAHGDSEIAALAVEAINSVDIDAFIAVETGEGFQTSLKRSEGLIVEEGFITAAFTDHLLQAQRTLANPLILVTDHEVAELEPLIPVLDAVYDAGRELLLIAADVRDEALKTLVVNDRSGALNAIAIRAPGREQRRADLLEDIAAATGATFISADQSMRLQDVTLNDLGQSDEVLVNSKRTHVSGGRADPLKLDLRRDHVRGQRDAATSEFAREELSRRLSSLHGESITITVGGLSEDEIKERRDRAANCVQSVRAARSTGVLPGGGIAFISAALALEMMEPKSAGERAGINSVSRAIQEPARLVANNQGGDGAYEVSRMCEQILVQNPDIEERPFDATSTLRLALSVAASLAGVAVGIEKVIHEN